MSGRTAFYPGSFDPLTLGHLDVYRQAMRLFKRVVVGIGVHPGKTPLFSFDERAALIRDALKADGTRDTAEEAAAVEIVAFEGLVIDAAKSSGAVALVRGIRDGTDLDYEMQMAGMNGRMAPDIVTLFLPARPEFRPITATLIRQIAKMGGDVGAFVPPVVADALRGRFA